MKIVIAIILIFSLIFVSGISGCSFLSSQLKMGVVNGTLQDRCISECLEMSKQKNLSSECLLDPIPNTEWICDIAHSPRTAEDNLKENQCHVWNSGQAKHFIELTPECKLIRIG